MKVAAKFPFQEIESIPPLVKDFIEGKLDGFQELVFRMENISKVIQKKQNFFSESKREVLVSVFKNQLRNADLNSKQTHNIHLLSKPTTFTVCTGHQLNLFSGPAFFIYKILQTIKTAELLKEKFPEFDFVPVFWMATEDHDFEEISFFKSFQQLFKTEANAGGAVGRIAPQNLNFIAEFAAAVGELPFGAELISLLEEAYAAGNTFADATRILVQKLFGEYGILSLDGDDAALKFEMKEIFKNELLQNSLVQKTETTVAFLKEKYGKVQVNPREINLFYLDDIRQRIDSQKPNFVLAELEKPINAEDLLITLDDSPQKFSPNALMRPVFQETVLPNIAYIGGNAEIMYWLELIRYFEFLNIPFPILVPRSSLLFITEKQIRKLEKLDIALKNSLQNPEAIVKTKLLEKNSILHKLDEAENSIRKIFADLKADASQTEKSFGNLVEAEQTRQLNSIQRMKKRLLRAEKRKESEKVARIRNIFTEIHPGGNWQERQVNFSEFYAYAGRDWLKTCLSVLNPEKPELIMIVV